MQRLYAIDVILRMVDRLHIAWVINFEFEIPRQTQNHGNVNFFDQDDRDELNDVTSVPPRVMVTSDTDTVYVSLPAPGSNAGSGNKFWAIKDNQTSSKPEILFKKDYALTSIATYEIGSNGQHSEERKRDGKWTNFGPIWDTTKRSMKEINASSVWGVLNNKEVILKISPLSGNIIKSLNVSQILKSKAMITSDLMVTRNDDSDVDHLVFTVTLVNGPSSAFTSLLRSLGMSKSNNKNYVIQMKGETLSWIVPTVKDLPGKGQIAGIKTHDDSINAPQDLYVVFAGNNETSIIFGVH